MRPHVSPTANAMEMHTVTQGHAFQSSHWEQPAPQQLSAPLETAQTAYVATQAAKVVVTPAHSQEAKELVPLSPREPIQRMHVPLRYLPHAEILVFVTDPDRVRSIHKELSAAGTRAPERSKHRPMNVTVKEAAYPVPLQQGGIVSHIPVIPKASAAQQVALPMEIAEPAYLHFVRMVSAPQELKTAGHAPQRVSVKLDSAFQESAATLRAIHQDIAVRIQRELAEQYK